MKTDEQIVKETLESLGFRVDVVGTVERPSEANGGVLGLVGWATTARHDVCWSPEVSAAIRRALLDAKPPSAE